MKYWQSFLFLLFFAINSATALSVESFAYPQLMETGQESLIQGDSEAALQQFVQAAAQARNSGDFLRFVDALVKQSEAYRKLGRHFDAIATLNTTLEILKTNPDKMRLANAYNSLGLSKSLMKEHVEARKAFFESLQFAKQTKNKQLISTVLMNKASAEARRGRYVSATQTYLQALENINKDNYTALAKAHSNLARVYTTNNLSKLALKNLSLAAQHAGKLDSSRNKAYLLISIGTQYRDLAYSLPNAKLLLDSLNAFKVAKIAAESIKDTRAESYATGYMGELYEKQQRNDEAITLSSQAIFLAQQTQSNEILYLWHWQLGRIYKSTGDLDRAIISYRSAVKELQSIREDLALSIGYDQGKSSFRDIIGPVFLELTDLLLQRSGAVADNASYLLEARQTIEKLKSAELQDYFQDECVVELQSKQKGVEELAGDTAVIYPIILKDRTEIILSLAGKIKQATVKVSALELTKEIRSLREKLITLNSKSYLPHSQQLYQWLIEPIIASLKENNIKTLVIVPDGPLRTIPISVFHDGNKFLIESYAIGTTPGLTLTDAKPLNQNKIKILLGGLTESVQGFEALPAVEKELQNISALFNAKVLINKDYQIETVKQRLEKTPYNIVHLASHGQFNSDPKDTFLLTYDEKMTMDRLKKFIKLSQFRDEPVELLTLSACSTAEGDDRAALGLAGIAVKAGARSVLASLWLINDAVTAELTTEFYKQLKIKKTSKAMALRKAQLLVLNRGGTTSHPGYWGPFLMIGSWL